MSANGYHANNSALDDYNSALHCYNNKSYQRALIYLESLLEKDPYHLDGYLMKSQCEFNLNDLGEAIKHVNRALEIIQSNDKEDAEFLKMKIKFLRMRSQIYEKLDKPLKAEDDANEAKLLLQESAVNRNSNGRLSSTLPQGNFYENESGIDNRENSIKVSLGKA